MVAMLPGTTFPAAVGHASCVEGTWGKAYSDLLFFIITRRIAFKSCPPEGRGSHLKAILSVEKICASIARKKKNSTPELWRPCLRTGYSNELIM